jgi:hypothetical protein
MCKKVAEEAAEVLLASKNGTEAEIVYEMADLWFHALVLLGHHPSIPMKSCANSNGALASQVEETGPGSASSVYFLIACGHKMQP